MATRMAGDGTEKDGDEAIRELLDAPVQRRSYPPPPLAKSATRIKRPSSPPDTPAVQRVATIEVIEEGAEPRTATKLRTRPSRPPPAPIVISRTETIEMNSGEIPLDTVMTKLELPEGELDLDSIQGRFDDLEKSEVAPSPDTTGVRETDAYPELPAADQAVDLSDTHDSGVAAELVAEAEPSAETEIAAEPVVVLEAPEAASTEADATQAASTEADATQAESTQADATQAEEFAGANTDDDEVGAAPSEAASADSDPSEVLAEDVLAQAPLPAPRSVVTAPPPPPDSRRPPTPYVPRISSTRPPSTLSNRPGPISAPAPRPRLAIGKNLANVQEELEKLQKRLAALEEGTGLTARFEQLETRFKPVRERVSELEERRRDTDAKLAGLERKIAPVDTKLHDIHNKVRAYDPRIEDLEVARERFYAFVERVDDAERSIEVSLDALVDSSKPPPPDELEAMKRLEGALERRLEELAMRVHSLESSDRQLLLARLDTMEKAARERDAQIASLKTQLTSGEFALPGDDLKRIKGIGPKFERLLHEAGVKSFAQMSKWTAEDVTKIAGILGVTEKRIQNSAWIAAAKKLC